MTKILSILAILLVPAYSYAECSDIHSWQKDYSIDPYKMLPTSAQLGWWKWDKGKCQEHWNLKLWHEEEVSYVYLFWTNNNSNYCFNSKSEIIIADGSDIPEYIDINRLYAQLKSLEYLNLIPKNTQPPYCKQAISFLQ